MPESFRSDPDWLRDPYLSPFRDVIRARYEKAEFFCRKIRGKAGWETAARYHAFFGLHRDGENWVFREWAPNAVKIFVLTETNAWDRSDAWVLEGPDGGGVFEGRFRSDRFVHGQLYRLRVVWEGGEGDRIPTAATRVVQDDHTKIFNAQVWAPPVPYRWQTGAFPREPAQLLVYEAHTGMALEAGRIGTFREFAEHILPKVLDAGYNTLQLMAVQEHPYYGSFGYHVGSFFAPSSRFGTPDDLKYLVDTAHGMGIRVLMDVVHSHGVRNEVEGLSRFDGTYDQFFHGNARGYHRLWDSRCFNYGKDRVVDFLLSTLRYFLEEFRMDGFRFDGITSMLFADHGIGRVFSSYADYFGPDVDEDALSYLYTANDLVHTLRPSALTIAEDVSGYPGLAAPKAAWGTGFDARFAMGIADHWIRLLKDVRDEDWHLGTLWFELTRRRDEERTISYVECHDQALVGDKTVMMRLLEGRIYQGMERSNQSVETFRAVALHKMIRLITAVTAHRGYLNFMGNEFGHPEWIDFPSERNGFSFHYARRQWSLKYNRDLFYSALFAFDREMTRLVQDKELFGADAPHLFHLHEDDKVLGFQRGTLLFFFNFHPQASLVGYPVDVPPGKYRMILDTDELRFGGPGRLARGQIHFTTPFEGRHILSVYLPCRSALVLEKENEAAPTGGQTHVDFGRNPAGTG